MGFYYSVPACAIPETDEEYLKALMRSKHKVLTSGERYIGSYLNDINNEITLTESRLQNRPRCTKCVNCLMEKKIPLGYSLCDDCILPVVSYYHSMNKH